MIFTYGYLNESYLIISQISYKCTYVIKYVLDDMFYSNTLHDTSTYNRVLKSPKNYCNPLKNNL